MGAIMTGLQMEVCEWNARISCDEMAGPTKLVTRQAENYYAHCVISLGQGMRLGCMTNKA